MKRERWIIAADALGAIRKEVWQPEAPSERAEALLRTLLPNAKPKCWGVLDDLSEMRGLIDAGLTGMGWPPSCAGLAVTEIGTWRIVESVDDLREGEAFRWSFLWIDKAAPPLTEAYWLGRMAFELKAAEDHFNGGDMLSFFHTAMRLGAYQTEIDVRRIALRYAETGKDIHQGSRRGNDMKSAGSFKTLHGEAAQARAHALHAEKPARTWARIRDLLAKEFDVSAETIRKSLRNPKKNG